MKPPVLVELSPQSTHKPLTRSMLGMSDVLTGFDRVQVGSFYAVLADTEDGFLFAKCKTVNPSEFIGLQLDKGCFQNKKPIHIRNFPN